MRTTIHSLKKIHVETIQLKTQHSVNADFLNAKRRLNKNILRRERGGTREKYHSSWAGNDFKIYAGGLQELTHFICGE